MVKPCALPQLSVANRAKGNGIAVRLAQVVGAHHQALVEDAVTMPIHMPDLMRCDLAYPHENPRLKLRLILILFISPLGQKPMQTLNATESRNSIPKAKVIQIFRKQINIRKRYHPNGVFLTVLYWPNNLL